MTITNFVALWLLGFIGNLLILRVCMTLQYANNKKHKRRTK